MTNQDLADLYRNAREAAGLSMESAQDVCGLSRQTLWRIENGKGGTLARLLTALEYYGLEICVRRRRDTHRS